MLRPHARVPVLLALVGMATAAEAAPLDPLAYTSLGDFTLTAPATIDTDACTFDDGVTVHTGDCSGAVAVFTFDNLTLSDDIDVVGAKPLALLAQGTLDADGVIDASGVAQAAGPGGFAGGGVGAIGTGPGAGTADLTGGGGGGGYGGSGGDGGSGVGLGGLPYGDLLTTLQGGSGGGGGTAGGGGGGAVELGATGLLSGSGSVFVGGGVGDGTTDGGGGGGGGGGVLLHGAVGSSFSGAIDASGADGADGTSGQGGGGGGGGRVALFGVEALGSIDVSGGTGGTASAGIDGQDGAAGSVTVDADADGFDATVDCDDTDPAYDDFIDWYPDCDGDLEPASAPTNLCVPTGPAGDICVGAVQPSSWALAAGTDCNDEDVTAQANSDFYPDCDGDLAFGSAAVNGCGLLGADALTPCVDTNVPDGGWSAVAGADCNDEDPIADALSDFYPDCDGDLAFDSTPTNACGLLGAQTAFDCFDGDDPDGGFGAVAGTDCNDEDGTATAFGDFYPDCDGDGAFEATPVNACGEVGADTVTPCANLLPPDGGWSGTAGADCDDEDATASNLVDVYPDCDGDAEFSSTAIPNVCGVAGASAAFDCVDGDDPDGGFDNAAGADCNDEDASAQALGAYYPDCDGDAVFSPTVVAGVCGEAGAAALFDCVDVDDPDGGFDTTAGTDCNDEDLTASALSSFFPDCDGDAIYSASAVPNVCGLTGASAAFDCADSNDPDGGFGTTAGTDCNDEDAAAAALSDWYPDCDADGVYSPASVSACGLLSAAAAFDCVDGANPDGGFVGAMGSDCNDEDASGSVVEPWFPDCDGDGSYASSSVNACALTGAAAAFDCVDGQNPDGGFVTVAGTDCDDEFAAAQLPDSWYPDCDNDGFGDPSATFACGIRGANQAFDCLDGQNPDGSWSLALGTDCDDEEGTTCPDDGQCADLCGDGVDNDCDGDGDWGTPGPGGFLDDDGDSLDYATEFGLGTDDCNLDSDNDGINDDVELTLLTDPTNADSDGDTLPDGLEAYVLGTDPLLPDTDGDQLRDDVEVGDPFAPTDTDSDGLIDALDPDDDGDGVSTLDEDWDHSGDPRNDASDSDGVPDYLDDDDDGDNVPTADEGAPGQNSDGDALPDFRDPDDDGDNVPTADEAYQGNPDPQLQDSDSDLTPDYLDEDDDDDGVRTRNEAYDGETDPQAQNTDGDVLPDYLDVDDDGDRVPTEDEGAPNQDTDGDLIPDYRDDDDDGDTILTFDEDIDASGDPRDDHTDADGVPDYLDDDDDDDNVPTADEAYTVASPLDEDTDGDGTPDYRDDDDDGDSVLTLDEDLDGDGDPRDHDTDGQAPPDYLDPDDDGDGIPTIYEEAEGTNRLSVDSDGDGQRDDIEWFNVLPLDDPGLCADDGCNPGSDNRCEDRDGGRTGLAFEVPWDRDGDGIINALDGDDDGDGINTILEGGDECLGNEPDLLPGHLDYDTDGDGICDEMEDPGDTDGDGTVEILDCDDDGCDGDADDDGLPNCVERFLLCPQDIDGNCTLGTPQLDPDSDGDGIPDGQEVTDPDCFLPEPGAACVGDNTDGDNMLDVYDIDDDGDGFATNEEIGCAVPSPLGDPDPDDGVDPFAYVASGFDPETLCDGVPFEPRDTDGDAIPNYLDMDDDGDGKESNIDGEEGGDPEGLGDVDGDGTSDYLDSDDFDGPNADADGDGFLNIEEATVGLDAYRVDSDGDGISDQDEVGGDITAPRDTDFDGVIDALDPDDDGDGVPTAEEGLGDPDGDGVPNHLDLDSNGDGEDDTAAGATADSDCDGFVDNLDLEPDDGPCGTEPDPYVVERYERQPCSCAAAPGAGAGWLGVTLGLLGLVRRRRS